MPGSGRQPVASASSAESDVSRLARELAAARASIEALEEERARFAAARAADDERIVTLTTEADRLKLLSRQAVITVAEQRRMLELAGQRENEINKTMNDKLTGSTAYRIGQVFIQAGRRPFTKGLLIPFTLIGLGRDVRRAKRQARLEAQEAAAAAAATATPATTAAPTG